MTATWTEPPGAGRDYSLTRAQHAIIDAAQLAAGLPVQGKSTGTTVTSGSAGRCVSGMINDPGPEAVAAALAAGWRRDGRKAPPPGQ